jgi:hypothetical protein
MRLVQKRESRKQDSCVPLRYGIDRVNICQHRPELHGIKRGLRNTVSGTSLRSCSQRSVLPSMSVKRKVTVPEGRSGMIRSNDDVSRAPDRLSQGRRQEHVGEAHDLIIGRTPVFGETVIESCCHNGQTTNP